MSSINHCCSMHPFKTPHCFKHLPVMVAPPLQHNSSREFGGSCCEGEDICMTIETDINGSAPSSFDFLAIEQRGVLQNRGSLLREKQISVDLISLKGTIRQASLRLASLTPTEQKSSGCTNLPLPLQPPKLKFLFTSLTDSAAASPLKKIWKSQNNTPPRPTSKLSRQQSVMDDSHLELQECSMRRSKSMGEGRSSAPADDFDLWLEKPATAGDKYKHKQSNSFSKPESTGNRSRKEKIKEMPEEEFKCGKLCLFLPTRGKGKPVRASSSSSSSSSQKTEPPVISRTVSLEKFECGSWSTSALSNANEDGESTNLFFSLPLEMIRCSVTDMQSPVTAAFVFDKEAKLDTEPKGVLRNGSVKANGGRKSQDSSRHVRFSASSHPSSPTCITPRLRKAREDFNAFLDAQSS
ncbi:hypothetical protein Nepgr_029562 [Nepenthes gracilis]|uniref:Uncharacterized protein n=1 Tax=Nepenthes gracilis TaxID=150966 RepID=A0AAD3Y571_NEPGR|nr:hypothetical protein Nepgr_029562 [Nepenthes gracilis]